MSGRQLRTALGVRLATLGYQRRQPRPHEDAYLDPENGHLATVVPFPRWGARVDILTVLSSFPLHESRALAFHLDLGSQIHDDAASVPGRWRGADLERLLDRHVVPYLDRARSPGAVLDMLLEGEIRPMGSGRAKSIVEHGYYLAKWWNLADRIDTLRAVAELVSADARAEMSQAPWGRTELAEVLWCGHRLTPPPPRLPWGLGDQADPRAEAWFQAAASARAEAAPEAQHARDEPEAVPSLPWGAWRGHESD